MTQYFCPILSAEVQISFQIKSTQDINLVIFVYIRKLLFEQFRAAKLKS